MFVSGTWTHCANSNASIMEKKNAGNTQNLLLTFSDKFCFFFSIIAVCFSGNVNGKGPDEIGGNLLISITSDDKHTVHVWKWMTNSDLFCQAKQIPGWFYGPQKKIPKLQQHGLFFEKSDSISQTLMN